MVSKIQKTMMMMSLDSNKVTCLMDVNPYSEEFSYLKQWQKRLLIKIIDMLKIKLTPVQILQKCEDRDKGFRQSEARHEFADHHRRQSSRLTLTRYPSSSDPSQTKAIPPRHLLYSFISLLILRSGTSDSRKKSVARHRNCGSYMPVGIVL